MLDDLMARLLTCRTNITNELSDPSDLPRPIERLARETVGCIDATLAVMKVYKETQAEVRTPRIPVQST